MQASLLWKFMDNYTTATSFCNDTCLKQIVVTKINGNELLFAKTCLKSRHYFDHFLKNRYFTLSAIEYITGTITKVRKVANVSPNIMVHDIGPQNITLSPPK